MDAITHEDFNMSVCQPRLAAANRRARALNLTLHDLCLRAGVVYSTVNRWALGKNDPGLVLFGAVMERLEAVLAAEENRLRKLLGAA